MPPCWQSKNRVSKAPWIAFSRYYKTRLIGNSSVADSPESSPGDPNCSRRFKLRMPSEIASHSTSFRSADRTLGSDAGLVSQDLKVRAEDIGRRSSREADSDSDRSFYEAAGSEQASFRVRDDVEGSRRRSGRRRKPSSRVRLATSSECRQ